MDDNTGAVRQINGGELSAKIAPGGREILRYEIIYPRIKAKSQAEERINRYHAAQAKGFERVIKSKYLPEARKQLKELDSSGAFVPLEVSASFQVMLSTNTWLSLFIDTYIQLRHSGSRLARSSKTYDMSTGRPVAIGALCGRGVMLREILARELEPRIASEDERNPGLYFSNWRQIFMENIGNEAYYLTDGGIVFYFRQHSIAGANAGIPSFLVPYSSFGSDLKFGL